MTADLQPKLRESALMALQRYGTGEDELQIETNEPGKTPYCEMSAHRIKIQLNATSATFLVKGGRWSGDSRNYPSAGSFIADFEEHLIKALSGNWR
jgi:hypothetical protein